MREFLKYKKVNDAINTYLGVITYLHDIILQHSTYIFCNMTQGKCTQ